MKETTFLSFTHNSPAGNQLMEWWEKLPDNRGDRARLRRCGSLIEVMFIETFHRLDTRLGNYERIDHEKLACVVGVLSHVKVNISEKSFASQMALPSNHGQGSRVSGLRFRRLLQCRNNDELFTALVRVVRLLDGTANVRSLAEDIYRWGDNTRKQLAFEYYSNAPSEP